MARMSARDMAKAATFDSSARARMNSGGGIKPGSKETSPPGNRDAKSIPAKGTKATGMGASKGDPRPKGEFAGSKAKVAKAEREDAKSDRAIAKRNGVKYRG